MVAASEEFVPPRLFMSMVVASEVRKLFFRDCSTYSIAYAQQLLFEATLSRNRAFISLCMRTTRLSARRRAFSSCDVHATWCTTLPVDRLSRRSQGGAASGTYSMCASCVSGGLCRGASTTLPSHIDAMTTSTLRCRHEGWKSMVSVPF